MLPHQILCVLFFLIPMVSLGANLPLTPQIPEESRSESPGSAPIQTGMPTPLVQCGCGGPHYQQAFREYEIGRRLASVGDAQCVDSFFTSALLSWSDLAEGLAEQPPRLRLGTLHLYNSAVVSCLIAGQAYGRMDPKVGLKVYHQEVWRTIPIVGVGLPWRLDQIDRLITADRPLGDPTFAQTIRGGVGTPLIGIHFRREGQPGEKRFLPQHPLPITAVLRVSVPRADENKDALAEVCLELHNPVQNRQLELNGYHVPLAGNSAASIAFANEQLQVGDNAWTAFFSPDVEASHEGLMLLEPYQPHKIPVVLVHGLISNPTTWGTLINQLQQDPELMQKYQIWLFFYETSNPFLESASILRKSLRETLAFLDPYEQDPALQNMILIGHSMGGLLSRLQVTWSGQHMWNELAKVPFSQIRVNPQFRQVLAESFFFGPQPFIKRVIFMAAPHQGSSWSYRIAGCIGRALAGQLPELQEGFAEMRRLNPDAFQPGTPRRLPTSIENLNPKSLVLRGLAKLPFSPCVHLHSVVGTGGCEPCLSGDAVVPVSSARLLGVESELFVDAIHTGVHTHPDSILEVKRILAIHWREYLSVRKVEPPPALISPIPVPSPVE